MLNANYFKNYMWISYMFIGEVMDAIHNPEKQSLIYNDGKYWSLQSIVKPNQEELYFITRYYFLFYLHQM